MMSYRLKIAGLSALVLLILISSAYADTAIRKSLAALHFIVPGKSEFADVDKKLFDAVDIIDKMSDLNKWADIRKLIDMPDLAYSRYYAELVYIYLAHVMNLKETWEPSNYYEREKLWSMMKGMQSSVHLFPAMLGRLLSQKNVPQNELALMLDYIESAPPSTLIHGPMLEGNVLFGFKMREDYSRGELPPVYTLKDYCESPTPLPGFSENSQYSALLEMFSTARYHREKMEKLARLYQKRGNREKAAAAFYQIAVNDFAAKDYQKANSAVLKSLLNNPNDRQTNELKKKIDLSLVLTAEKKPTNFERTYEGTINDKYPIEMQITRDGTALSGNYFYRKIGTKITLKGSVTDQNHFVIKEFDPQGEQTGIFNGSFVSDTEVAGTWSKPNGEKVMPFSLRSINSQ